MNGQFFQRYHGKENTHSSNAMMLLQRLYYYSPEKFYEVVENLFEEDFQAIHEKGPFLPHFKPQDTKNGKGSIPDFSVYQSSFKLIVEAKEYGNFGDKQLEQHLIGLSKTNYDCKMLIALSPSVNDQSKIDNFKKDFRDIHIIHRTYISFYDIILHIMNKVRDYEFMDLLEDYKNYCVEEGLIDTSDNTIMVRCTGATYQFCMDNGVYYDKCTNNAIGFKYLALYGDKEIKAIGKLTKVIEAYMDNGKIVYGKDRYYVKDKTITDSDIKKVEAAINDRDVRYKNADESHWHYIVDKFIPVDNFKKTSKGGLFGRKRFYLEENFGLNPTEASIEDIVNAMNKCGTWENIKKDN